MADDARANDELDFMVLARLRAFDARFSVNAFKAQTQGRTVNTGDVGDLFFGESVYVLGRETAVAIVNVDGMGFRVTAPGGDVFAFEDVVRIRGRQGGAPVAVPGDGGTIVIARTTNEVIGAVVGGDTTRNMAYVIPAWLVLG